ncbi:isoleucine--tRNA ligase [candidate division TA06 bacterium]|uniref:Isoleucine--tRNA ligase n=1 Tax=candidate division TA06 bacterium TaxID=2250710 RepID=A0A933IB04_UNCT6|nr:isoleucine--tRNA ligase [candidate division TA06 bacterium]
MYQDVSQNLDFPELEKRVLKFWEDNKTFEKLAARNRGSAKRFRFMDGPITANNPMGVHHVWGRTYKDLYHRYKAMQGYDARYQNGFDCQGLWIEVEVEKELGFKSKRDIEAYGIERFVNRCKDRVDKYSKVQTEQSIRLGQWMDWDNSYFTMAPDNNYAIWHFLKKCHERGWIYQGTDVMPWCARCGIALSNQEIATEGYQEMTHKSVYIQLPIVGRDKEYLLVWTTTPWTLTSNTAVAVHPDFTYLKVRQEGNVYYMAKGRKEVLKKDYETISELPGRELVGLKYQGPFDHLEAQKGIEHRTVAWKEVTEEDGTGMVHIAPGCGKEDFALSKVENLKVVAPLDEAGIYLPGFDWLSGKNVNDVAEAIVEDLKKRGALYYAHKFTHRYPECWRCHSELVFRLVDEWFISMGPVYDKPYDQVTAEEKKNSLRYRIMDSVKQARWIPDFGLDRELDWLKNMDDWCISRKRYWGLALPIFKCVCGNLEVIGSYQELKKCTVAGWDKFEGHTPHRPWLDDIRISCNKCGREVARIPDVGNVWLDAGIVMFSTIMPLDKCYTPDKENSGKYRYDPTQVYPENREYWKEWFPAEFITECFPGQFRNWFYAILTMSTVLEGKSPFQCLLGHALVKDEKGEDMHKSAGNSIPFDEAAGKIGADLMRWMFCCQNPVINLNFGYHTATEFKRKLLTLHNVYSFYITYAKLDGFVPQGKSLDKCELTLLDNWILSELNLLVKGVREKLDDYDVASACKKLESFTEDLSTWYVRRSRRRFWKSESDSDKEAAYFTLYTCLETLLRVMAPIMPFWAEEMYQNLVRSADPKAPESVHLTEYPSVDKKLTDQKLSDEMALVRKVVSLGHAARKEAKLKVRQPLEIMYVGKINRVQFVGIAKYEEIIKDEINVKKIDYALDIDFYLNWKVKPDFTKLGPKYGKDAIAIAKKLSALSSDDIKKFQPYGEVPIDFNGTIFQVNYNDFTREKEAQEDYAMQEESDYAVVLKKQLSPELLSEGCARELVHGIQNLRKESGFEVSDRITVIYRTDPELSAAIEKFKTYIMNETLALNLTTGSPETAGQQIQINGHPINLVIEQIKP